MRQFDTGEVSTSASKPFDVISLAWLNTPPGRENATFSRTMWKTVGVELHAFADHMEPLAEFDLAPLLRLQCGAVRLRLGQRAERVGERAVEIDRRNGLVDQADPAGERFGVAPEQGAFGFDAVVRPGCCGCAAEDVVAAADHRLDLRPERQVVLRVERVGVVREVGDARQRLVRRAPASRPGRTGRSVRRTRHRCRRPCWSGSCSAVLPSRGRGCARPSPGGARSLRPGSSAAGDGA